MMRTIYILLFFLFTTFIVGQEEFRVAFYNTENLYDTIRNEKINDEDFTPQGNLHWGTYRYQQKTESIAQVLTSLGDSYPPALIGMCEVENESVVKDLLATNHMQKHNYKYAMTKSQDARGSNIVLLYQRDQFRLISKRTYRPKLDNLATTRDLLHITGEVVSGDTLDVFVCHFPSRWGGVKKSELQRLSVAALLSKMINKVLQQRADAKILIMGDFNDVPDGNVYKAIESQVSLNNKSKLVNLMTEIDNDSIKSYYYQGKWLFYDQFIISQNLLDKQSSCHINPPRPFVFAPSYMMDIDDKYKNKKPFRTFSGWKYLEGYSDHLPIYINLFIKENF